MKKQHLLKTMLLLCALVVGSGSVWADTVTFDATKDVDADAASYQTTEKTYTATDGSTWKANGYGATKNTNLIIGKGGANYLLTPNVTGTISSVAVTWSGNSSYYLALQTTAGTELEAKSNPSSSDTKIFTVTGSYSQLKLVGRRASGTSNAAATITKVVVTYTPSGGPTTYSVFYDGNDATSGTAPTDETAYSSGASVTVKGNTGGLAKTGFTFDGWNTKSDGTGTDYSAGATFEITANTTLYAKWIFVVTDGFFDFVNAAKQAPLEDYGSGMSLSSGAFTTDTKTWKAGNVTMATSRVSGNGYRWWSADGTLRFYDESNATFSVPSGYVITNIVTTGANFDSSTPTGLSGSTWTGVSESVKLTATDGHNIKTITVTYKPGATITASGYNTFSSTEPLDLSTLSDGTTAYVATAVSGGKVVLSKTTAKVPASTGLFISGTAGEGFSVDVATGETTPPAANLLVAAPNGTTVKAAGSGYNYVFGWSDSSNPGFYLIDTTDADLAAGKAYLHTTSALTVDPTARGGFIFEDEETTGISEVSSKKVFTGDFYNLAGQKVSQPTKGLYIVNGKKVIIK